MRRRPLFSRSNDGGCVTAVMWNALRKLKGENMENEVAERMRIFSDVF